MEPSAVIRLRARSIEWRVVDGEVVVLDLETSEYLHLNRTAAVLWQRLSDGAAPPDMARHLVETYGVTDEQAASDVDEFLGELAAKRLLDGA